MTVFRALQDRATARPNGLAFLAGEIRYDYRRLLAESGRLARALIGEGVQPGDRVALHMTNLPELAVAYFACFRMGAIAVPINIRLKTAEIQSMLERLKPALYLGTAELYPLVALIDTELLPAGARFVVGGPVADPRARPWMALVGRHVDATELPEPDPDAPALLLATSGTTGAPKFVAHTARTINALVERFPPIELDARDITVNAAPMMHAAGFFIFMAGILSGTPVILAERFDPEAVLDAFERYAVTWFVGLPFMFAGLIEAQKARPRRVNGLRLCLTSGDVCPVEIQEEFALRFATPLRSFWGSSETAGSLAHGRKNGPLAHALPECEIRLVDDAGRPVARGEPGELLIRGPNMAVGYWQGPGRIDPVAPDGWYRTGDLMRQGEGDELWYVARKKDLIVRGGSNISPVEVELALKSHPAVEDAGVVGVPDPVLGQRVAAILKLKHGVAPATWGGILADTRKQLADYKTPERLVIARHALPRNAQGKIDRKALLALATEQDPDLVI